MESVHRKVKYNFDDRDDGHRETQGPETSEVSIFKESDTIEGGSTKTNDLPEPLNTFECGENNHCGKYLDLERVGDDITQCEFKFDQGPSLKIHMTNLHEIYLPPKPAKHMNCGLCDVRVISRIEIEKHMHESNVD